jgi:hypothetical protein
MAPDTLLWRSASKRNPDDFHRRVGFRQVKEAIARRSSVSGAAQIRTRDRDRMTQRGDEPPQASQGFVEESELA